MNYAEIFQSLIMQLGYKPTTKQIAETIGVKVRALYTRSQRPEQKFSLEEMLKIEQAFGVKLVNNPLIMDNIRLCVPEIESSSIISPQIIIEETKEKAITIPYWNDCEVNSEKIINPCFSELQLDLQKIIHTYKANYENLRTIAMPGDEMDGGAMPLRNNDMLVIDISINDTSSTGVYFCKNNSSIFVRRIVELVGEGIYISVDNPIYSDILNGKMTYKELEDVGFKIIGKVIGNESWKL